VIISILVPSATILRIAKYSFKSEEGGRTFLQNISAHLPKYSAMQNTRQYPIVFRGDMKKK
jgi:hypothetical protein